MQTKTEQQRSENKTRILKNCPDETQCHGHMVLLLEANLWAALISHKPQLMLDGVVNPLETRWWWERHWPGFSKGSQWLWKAAPKWGWAWCTLSSVEACLSSLGWARVQHVTCVGCTQRVCAFPRLPKNPGNESSVPLPASTSPRSILASNTAHSFITAPGDSSLLCLQLPQPPAHSVGGHFHTRAAPVPKLWLLTCARGKWDISHLFS